MTARERFRTLVHSPLEWALAITLGLCIARLWAMPLGSSFWVDEMATVFVVHHGASDPTLRAAPQVADSLYYALPKISESLLGFSELSYRIPSLLAMAGALFLVARLAARLIYPQAAWFAAFACLTSRGFNYQADDARPYALGSFVLALAMLLLVRWMDSGRMRDGLLFASAASLLWWIHLIFWPFYLIFGCYALFRMCREETPVPWWQAAVVLVLITCAEIPVVMRSLSLLRDGASHVVVPVPTIGQLLSTLKVGLLLAICVAALLVGWFMQWNGRRNPEVAASSALLILCWWLIDPLCLFAYSRIASQSVFVPRYLFLAQPGVVLIAALIVARFMPSVHWKQLALALGLVVLIFGGPLRAWHHNSDWRHAAHTLRIWSHGDNVPVICPSPFIEARPPEWRPDYPISGFLYSNLAVYKPAGRIYPFPFEASAAAEANAQKLLDGTLAPAGRFAIYGGMSNVQYWQRWYAAKPELHSWQNRVVGRFGDVELVAFSKR